MIGTLPVARASLLANERDPGLRSWLPLGLAVAFAAVSFWPLRERLVGTGNDPTFNAWTFELVWGQLERLGPWGPFTEAFWRAPIYVPGSLQLAYLEGQLCPAVLLWPLHRLGLDTAFVLDLGLLGASLLAFWSTSAWLGALGFPEVRSWGGLLFAACGWCQVQAMHLQNHWLFVIPLALLCLERFLARPGVATGALAALAAGWCPGWNLHFFVFVGLLFAGRLAFALWKNELGLGPALLLGAGALACAGPFVWPYVAASGLQAAMLTRDSSPAMPWTIFGRFERPSLLEWLWPAWPRVQVRNVEAAGGLGFLWGALALAGAVGQRRLALLGGALLCAWASFGLGAGLFDVLHLLPGVSGIRASGRLTLLIVVCTLPLVVGFLETLGARPRAVLLALLLLELCPAGPPGRAFVPALAPAQPSSWAGTLVQGDEPLLVLPGIDEEVQLAALRWGVPLFQGISSRYPPLPELVERLAHAGPVEDAIDLVRATRALTVQQAAEERLRASPRASEQGCAESRGRRLCLFSLAPRVQQPPLLRLDRDFVATSSPQAGAARATLVLRAVRAGELDGRSLDACVLERRVRLGPLPLGTAREWLSHRELPHGRLGAGQVGYAIAYPQRSLLGLPVTTTGMRVVCAE